MKRQIKVLSIIVTFQSLWFKKTKLASELLWPWSLIFRLWICLIMNIILTLVTITLTSSARTFLEGLVRFTMVPLTTLSDQKFMRYTWFLFKTFFLLCGFYKSDLRISWLQKQRKKFWKFSILDSGLEYPEQDLNSVPDKKKLDP